MAFLKKHKRESGTYIYIAESIIVDGKKTVRLVDYFKSGNKSLGILGKTITIGRAKRLLAKYITRSKTDATEELTFRALTLKFISYYKTQVDRTIQRRTYELFIEMVAKFDFLNHHLIADISTSTIEDFKVDLCESDLSNRTVNMILSEIKKVLSYARDHSYLDQLPVFKRLSESSSRLTNRLTRNQLNEILKISTGDIYYYFFFMCFTGLRTFEESNLLCGDIDLDKKLIHIKSTNKLKPSRTIPIHETLIPALKPYMKEPGDRFSPFKSRHTLYATIKAYGNKIGVKISPRSLRKTYGSLMAENGVPIIVLKELMGHNNVETTAKYYIDIQASSLSPYLDKHPLS
tara:strand:+ start:186 stop:1226 length:1041 start_codon:yes stop_codon:yes gene_type:complete